MLVNSVFQLGDIYAGKIRQNTGEKLNKLETEHISKRITEAFEDGDKVAPLAAVKALPEFLHLRYTDKRTYNRRERIATQALELLVSQGLAQKTREGCYVIVKKNPAAGRDVCCFRVNFYAAIATAAALGA